MTKLTITGRAETIIGILQKLEICDAQWNINEGFTVALDTTDLESDTSSEPTSKTPNERSGRKKKSGEPSSCKVRTQEVHLPYVRKTVPFQRWLHNVLS